MDRSGILSVMERAGCEAVYLGVESLCNEHLIYLGKTQNPIRYLDALQSRVVPALLDSRIECYLNLQLGLPDEYEHHRDSSLERLRLLGDLAVSVEKEITIFPQLHVIYPGTQHFLMAVHEGRFGPLGNRVFERFTLWEDEQRPILRWLGEHFAHGVGGIPEGILSPGQLRTGRFAVDPDRILEITSYLRDIENVEGVSLFKYGRYLASNQDIDLPQQYAEAAMER